MNKHYVRNDEIKKTIKFGCAPQTQRHAICSVRISGARRRPLFAGQNTTPTISCHVCPAATLWPSIICQPFQSVKPLHFGTSNSSKHGDGPNPIIERCLQHFRYVRYVLRPCHLTQITRPSHAHSSASPSSSTAAPSTESHALARLRAQPVALARRRQSSQYHRYPPVASRSALRSGSGSVACVQIFDTRPW